MPLTATGLVDKTSVNRKTYLHSKATATHCHRPCGLNQHKKQDVLPH